MDYFQPERIKDAVALAQTPGAFYLAGGTDMNLQIREGKVYPDALIDLGKVKELKIIELREEELLIGSMVTFDDCLRSDNVRQYAFALWQACQTMGSPQIRHQATIGGNLGNCSPAADAIPPLLALDTKVDLVSLSGEEVCPLKKLLERTPILIPGTLIKAFRIPRNGWVSGFIKLGRRQALAISRLNVAVSFKPIENHVDGLRIALGAVGNRPYLLDQLSQKYHGRVIDNEWIRAVCFDAQSLVKGVLGSRASAPYKSVALGGILHSLLTQVIEKSASSIVNKMIASQEGRELQ
jgi:CO/xanthine dehydrogenase FAD-binding subunit